MVMETLDFIPARRALDLVAPATGARLQALSGRFSLDEDVQVGRINPDFAGGVDFCSRYGIEESKGANCVVVEGRRGERKTYAACLVPVCAGRTDFNGIVRKALDARQVSLAPLPLILERTGMEYGSITVVGLPEDWRIFIDSAVGRQDRVVIGSGLKISKMLVRTDLLKSLPGAEVIEGLAS